MIVLIVEDRAEIRGLWKKFLEPLGALIREAETLAEARAIMLTIPPPDIILLDPNLPDSKDRDTLSAIEELRARNPRCVVIVLTGIPDESLYQLAREMGADAFSQKSETATQSALWRVMKSALEKPSATRSEPPFEKSISMLEKLTALICSSAATTP